MSQVVEVCFPFKFRDAKGQTRTIKICLSISNAVASYGDAVFGWVDNVTTALQAVSSAHVQCAYNITNPGAGQGGIVYGSTDTYQDVEDSVVFSFLLATDDPDTASGVSAIQVPAPLATIFLADQETVNMSDAHVLALWNALTDGNVANTVGPVLSSGSGYPYLEGPGYVAGTTAGFLSGFRVRKKLKRKFNKFTLDPTLTISGM